MSPPVSFLWLALNLLVAGVLSFSHRAEKFTPLNHPRDAKESYDYIVVGAGTAGLTVADRLTENKKTTVLVVEYGELDDSPILSELQAWFRIQISQPQFFYNITSVPQPSLRNRTFPLLIGKLVGGSSAVNAMMAIRGSKQDYDQWGAFFGKSSSWTWKGMLPYFKKAVHFTPPVPALAPTIPHDAALWGTTSGVHAAWPSFQYPATLAQVDTWRDMAGVNFRPDSGTGLPGLYWYPTFMDPTTATRSYVRTGHYENVRRPNYHLLTGSKVNKILLQGTKAYGVRFASVANGIATSIRANKEVILAAGAIHTPQIMQLSGLGPERLLQSANISVAVDLPGVGQNFQDHLSLSANFTYLNFDFNPSINSLAQNATFRAWADEVWAANRSGPYSLAAGNVGPWLPFPVISSRHQEIASRLSAQDHAALLPAGTHPTVIAGYRAQMKAMVASIRDNATAFFNMPLNGRPTTTLIANLHSLSRGTVNIDPQNPEAEPRVDYRALSNPLDGAISADILRYLRTYFGNSANAPYQPVEVTPGANLTSDEQLVAFIQQTMRPSGHHPAGTCAMLPRHLGGVVDENLKVYGVRNLRIVDASVMPMVIGANTCLPVYAVAEKAADIIKAGK